MIMKDSMIIDSKLANKFWAEVIKTTNYLQNRLPTRSQNYSQMISKETLTNR